MPEQVLGAWDILKLSWICMLQCMADHRYLLYNYINELVCAR